MALRMLAKDEESGRDHCPSVYLDDDGSLVVQGNTLGGEEMSQLANVLPNETAVRINPAVVIAAMQRYHGGTP